MSRFIPGPQIAAVSRWKFSDIDTAAFLLEQQSRDHKLRQQMEQARQQAHTQGFAEGFEQGRAQTQLEAQQHLQEYTQQQGQQTARQLADLLQAARLQLQEAEQVSAQAVLELACEIARLVLRQELSHQPTALLPLIREALQQLFADSQAVLIRLHPQDLQTLTPHLQQEYPEQALKLQADPGITPGGCLVESGGAVLDGRLEKRWAQAIARLGQQLPWAEAADGKS